MLVQVLDEPQSQGQAFLVQSNFMKVENGYSSIAIIRDSEAGEYGLNTRRASGGKLEGQNGQI